jgi:hypothetical protein
MGRKSKGRGNHTPGYNGWKERQKKTKVVTNPNFNGDDNCWIAKCRPTSDTINTNANLRMYISRAELFDTFHLQRRGTGSDNVAADLMEVPISLDYYTTQRLLMQCAATQHSTQLPASLSSASTTITPNEKDLVVAIHLDPSFYAQRNDRFYVVPQKHLPHGDCGDGVLNPYDPSIVANKYWAQRHRLFSRFDQGIRMDPDGWYSVTPELIAQHIAHQLVSACSPLPSTNTKKDLVILDAFVGVGGNAIALAQHPQVKIVICVDNNLTRLQMAAHNCQVYQIPTDKVVFICDDVFHVMDAYQNGKLIVKDTLATGSDPPGIQINDLNSNTNSKTDTSVRVNLAVASEFAEATLSVTSVSDEPNESSDNGSSQDANEVLQARNIHSKTENDDPTGMSGYTFGNHQVLPQSLDAVFLSPPWGGQEYATVGLRGYSLHRIQLDNGKNGDDILCSAVSSLPAGDGVLAYFLPRNLNGHEIVSSIAKAQLPGCVLEQNRVNGKLKTVTLYAKKCI